MYFRDYNGDYHAEKVFEDEAKKYPCENTVTTWTQTRLRDGALQTP